MRKQPTSNSTMLATVSAKASAAKHIDVVYHALTHTLVRYEGIGNIRSADARNLDVRIDFPVGARTNGVAIADIAAAASTNLNGKCRLP